MTTAILIACLEHLKDLGLSPMPPTAEPGIEFNPPDSGMWLEALLFPNEPDNIAWDNDSCVNARGFFQVSVFYRPGVGQVQASLLADEIIDHFKKGTILGGVRVYKKPWQSPAITDEEKLYIPVTIPYRGLIK